ncbi:MAG: histidinol-phosphatase HisJ family protein [Thermomicrobiales bacterium]
MFDYHVHTTRSIDCNTPIEAPCKVAIARGLSEIAFTDHVDHEPADDGFGFYDYEGYCEDIERARDRFGDRLVILAGAEVDFNTRIAGDVERFLSGHQFDFAIGSVHYGDAGEIIFPEYFSIRSLDDVLPPYYEQIHAAVETGWFDTIGHLDLPKRYAPPSAGTYDPLRYTGSLRPIFASMIDRQLSFEINTSGLRQAPKASMPGPQIVSLYQSMGGALITLGSDSHVPKSIGAGMERTLDMLCLCGIHHISSFRQRQYTQVSITDLRARNQGD